MGFEGDWVFLRAALPELQAYLLSPDLYRLVRQTGHTANSIQTPQLSLGNVLLSLARLSALELAPARQMERDEFIRQVNDLRQAWQVHWEQKAAREFTARLKQWAQYLNSLLTDPSGAAAVYPSQARLRAVLGLLQTEMGASAPAGAGDHLAALDEHLRGQVQPGPFVWEPEAAGAFSPDLFWYLYRTVKH